MTGMEENFAENLNGPVPRKDINLPSTFSDWQKTE